MREWNFDGLCGPTHNYAGLSPGNLASSAHQGTVANPRAAALQGLNKMRFLAGLGLRQAVLPPHERPHVGTLRRLGFGGTDAAVIERAAREQPQLLRLVSSASAMWTANAATVVPSSDTDDGRVHLTPANLSAMFHRSLEVETTTRVLRRIFADERCFAVHTPLPGGAHFSDEGAANHLRLSTRSGTVQWFGWGRSAWPGSTPPTAPAVHPARQTLEASLAVARKSRVREGLTLTWQQAPSGIDAGAFHTDVLAVANENVLLLHEQAFVEPQRLLAELHSRLGDELSVIVASEAELPARDAVSAYPFNSQLVTLPSGRMAIVAPRESEHSVAARAFLERVLASDAPVDAVHHLDVNASMNNGGGPACLRLRVPLTDVESAALGARVELDDALFADLERWVERHYRDRLAEHDLRDPGLLDETRSALDELTRLLALGDLYDFQRDAARPGTAQDDARA